MRNRKKPKKKRRDMAKVRRNIIILSILVVVGIVIIIAETILYFGVKENGKKYSEELADKYMLCLANGDTEGMLSTFDDEIDIVFSEDDISDVFKSMKDNGVSYEFTYEITDIRKTDEEKYKKDIAAELYSLGTTDEIKKVYICSISYSINMKNDESENSKQDNMELIVYKKDDGNYYVGGTYN